MVKIVTGDSEEKIDVSITSWDQADAVVKAVGLAGHRPKRIVKQRGRFRVECVGGKTGLPFTVTRITDDRLKERDRVKLRELAATDTKQEDA